MRWSPDRQTAWRVRDGERQGEMSADDAAALVEELGLLAAEKEEEEDS